MSFTILYDRYLPWPQISCKPVLLERPLECAFCLQLYAIVIVNHVQFLGIQVSHVREAQTFGCCESIGIVAELQHRHAGMRVAEIRPHHMHWDVQQN